MLRDGRLHVADALMTSSHFHLSSQEKRANRFKQTFGVKQRRAKTFGVCTHSAGTLEGCH